MLSLFSSSCQYELVQSHASTFSLPDRMWRFAVQLQYCTLAMTQYDRTNLDRELVSGLKRLS